MFAQAQLAFDRLPLVFGLLDAIEHLGDAEHPQIRTMKSKPEQLRDAKGNRGIPLTTSRPTVVSSRPSIVGDDDLERVLPRRTPSEPKAIIVRAKNSAGPNGGRIS